MSLDSVHFHVDDFGARLTVTVKDEDDAILDLSNATAITFYLIAPSGTIKEKTPSLLTDGTDGKIYYDLIDGDLNEVGWWKERVRVLYTGKKYNSDVGEFFVAPND